MKKNSNLSTTSIWLSFILIFLLLHFGYQVVNLSGSVKVLITDPVLLALLWFLNRQHWQLKINYDLKIRLAETLRVNSLPLILGAFFILAIIAAAKFSVSKLIYTFILALVVAIFEEFFFRGILLNNFIAGGHRKYADYFKAILFVSFLFGMTHLVNLVEQTLVATLLQMLNAFVLGILLAALYLRTGRLSWPIFYHFILDFTGILFNGIVTQTPTTASLPASLGMMLLYLLTGLFLLRKKYFWQWQRKDSY